MGESCHVGITTEPSLNIWVLGVVAR